MRGRIVRVETYHDVLQGQNADCKRFPKLVVNLLTEPSRVASKRFREFGLCEECETGCVREQPSAWGGREFARILPVNFGSRSLEGAAGIQ